MTDCWYDEWEYKNFILPAERVPVYVNKRVTYVSHAEKNYGKYFFYEDELLWLYAGRLSVEKMVSNWHERIYDIAERGDITSRIKAFVILSYISPHDNRYQKIIKTWLNAESYIDTIDVSPSLITDEKQFYQMKTCANGLWNIVNPSVSEEDVLAYINRDINRGTDYGEKMFPSGKKTKAKSNIKEKTKEEPPTQYKSKPLFEIKKIKRD